MESVKRKKKRVGTLFSVPVIVSILVLSAVILLTIFAGQISSYDPEAVNMTDSLQSPSLHHLLGTDNIGRDQFTRLLFGARTTLTNALLVVMLSAVIGIPLGLLCGYYGGWIDLIIMKLWDCILAFPALLLAFLLVAALGRSSYNAVIAIGIVYIPMISKLSRTCTMTEKTKPYVEAAKTLGYSGARIVFIHIFPNCVSTLLAELTLDVGYAIMSLASLSFLGLGVQLPKSDWGSMLQEGMALLLKSPILALAPGIAIVLSVVSLNVLSDGIQMYLDPEQRKLPKFKKRKAKAQSEPAVQGSWNAADVGGKV